MKEFDVLLIEDDVDLCSVIARIIADAGYTIQTAENGLMAQDLLRSDNYRMIISDINLPNRNGLQLAALARGSKRHARVPIVLISGCVDVNVAKKAKELRIVDILVKPIESQDLLSKIKSYLHTPMALRVNPMFQNLFEKASKQFFDEFMGNHTIIAEGVQKLDTPIESEITSFLMFENREVSGEIVFTSTRKVIHEVASAKFHCKDNPEDDESMVNMTMKVMEKLGAKYVNQLAANGVQLKVSPPKVQLNFADQELVERAQSLVCIPFSTGEKACRIDFIIKPTNIVGKTALKAG